MTNIGEIEIECSVCGGLSDQFLLLSTNTMGAPDLDLRPAEMQRSTMHLWVVECPHCGYVAKDLSNQLKISEDFLKTDKYLGCDGFKFKDDLAVKFYKNYLILNESDDVEGSFYNLLHCAWACDDAEDMENSRKIRKLAAEYINKLIEISEGLEKNNFIVMKSDILRRSGEFKQLIDEYDELVLGDMVLDNVISFQVNKARENDDKCYTLDDVNS